MDKILPCQSVVATSDKIITLDRSISPSRDNIEALRLQGHVIRFRSPWRPHGKEPDEISRSKALSQDIDCDQDQPND
jgi:hypothetical protein